jgi:hypothetical protein
MKKQIREKYIALSQRRTIRFWLISPYILFIRTLIYVYLFISVYSDCYMSEEIVTMVKIPITEIEDWIRARHVLPSVLAEYRLDGNDLVLCFKEEVSDTELNSHSLGKPIRRRRSRRKRNRMKTRGWQVVARITNLKGQKCTIYKPFVDALKNQNITDEEQRKLVEKILRSNRNRPSEASIQYFLENTLEYLKKGL